MIAGTYVLDPAHTTIGFVARHAMVTKTRGKFEDFEGTITVAENIADSKADVTIKSASINTGNDDRDGHVKGDDFFAVEKYPELTFTATSFNVDEAGNGPLPAISPSRALPSRSPWTLRPRASLRILSATPASASRQPPRSTVLITASTSTHR